MTALAYQRVLLKLSGEALMGEGDFGLDPQVLQSTAQAIAELAALGVQPALVIGGGNIFRGASLKNSGVHKVTADQIGMLATVMNALAMKDTLQNMGLATRVFSSIEMPEICEKYVWWKAVRHLDKGRAVICAAGTGNPFFTTDTAAALRAIELSCDLLIKATKVDGVYSDDPLKNPNAQRYDRLSYAEVIDRRLAVMDTTAVVLCRDHRLPLRVLDMTKPHALLRAVSGAAEGTLVQE
ncbi:MAG: kinase [Pseudomonadota bacterium]|jgi:uridylate kinase